MLNANGHAIDYQETGEGPAVLFLPGSFSTPAAWRGVQTRLPQNYRFVGTSLLGYGGTQETRSPVDPAISHQIRMIDAVARHIDAPLHLVAHSFGGAVALTTALANVADIRPSKPARGFSCAAMGRYLMTCWN
jgi:pimeloyl-ACP methyl ester carboxylesterase